MATLTSPTSIAIDDRRGNRPDVTLITLQILLSALGLIMIYSATRFALERAAEFPTFTVERQAIFVTAGLIAFYLISQVDYREYETMIPLLYGGTLVGLAAVFLFDPINGARRWIPLQWFNLQPAEFAKVVVILTVAYVLAVGTHEDQPLRWKKIFQTGLWMAVPFVMIAIEPDLGTALVFPFVWFIMLFVAGATWKQLTSILATAFGAIALAWRTGVLEEHQMDRISVFMDPAGADPQGIGFQLRQSKLAIGSGQLFGKGLFEGTQTNFSYVPDQETDFIFTAVGEQLGFVGGIVVLFLFALIVWRLIVIALSARDRFGSLLAAGTAAMVVFHVFINIGMTIGIAPVTGLPLPFLSMGGSFYLAMSIAFGICNSVYLRRTPVPGERYRSRTR
ncbi:MAG: rod shape-determining protein RodA [Acidimicrobiia bacterium]